jgi:hypothetical protein
MVRLRVIFILIGILQLPVAKSKKIDIFEFDLNALGEDYFKLKKNLRNEEKRDEKIYLKDLLENINGSNAADILSENRPNSSILTKELCKLKTIEVSLKLAKCGRIRLNTTSCDGSCKSSSHFIINYNQQKITCYTCKAYEFEYVKHKVKCANGLNSFFLVKSVKKCNCLKNSENVYPVKLINKF